MEEANKLIGAGKKHLVMGKVVEAVSTLQEACGMLAKKYGDTADECAEAFFWCGKALLDMARMENSVLGNALEGVPADEDEEKPKDSNVEGTENVDEKTRDELRVQVYEAMAEKPEDAQKNEGREVGKKEAAEKTEEELSDKEVEEPPADEVQPEDQKVAEKVEESAQKEAQPEDKTAADKTEGPSDKEAQLEDKMTTNKTEGPSDKEAQPEDKMTTDKTEKPEDTEAADKVEETPTDKEEPEDKKVDEDAADKNVEEQPSDKMEEEPAEEEEDAEDGDEADTEEQGEENNAGEKESDDEDEVGNLQLAWEMLEVAKVIYKRKEAKEDQLMAAQTHLKLGEVSAETGNYTQALEDFQECLKLQLKHLDPDSRLLAETHYQLGLTFSLNMQYQEAIVELNSSISVIKSRLEKLTELIQNAAGPEELAEERKEMEELKALLPEIQEKVEDATEGLKTGRADAEAVKGVLGGASTSAFPASTGEHGSTCGTSESNGTSTAKVTSTNGAAAAANTPVSDISHLVRKKRKPEESPVKEGVKKVKQDNAQETDGNGVNKTNGDSNGHTNSMEVESQ